MMVTQRKKLTLREQIFNEKTKAWDLYCNMRVCDAMENTKESVFRDIYDNYQYGFRVWGGVEFVYWIRALAKKCKSYDANITPLAIFELPNRNDGDTKKILNLKVIAKQMGLDVEIANNRKTRPPVVRKNKETAVAPPVVQSAKIP